MIKRSGSKNERIQNDKQGEKYKEQEKEEQAEVREDEKHALVIMHGGFWKGCSTCIHRINNV